MGRKNIKFKNMTNNQIIMAAIPIFGTIALLLAIAFENKDDEPLERKEDTKNTVIVSAIGEESETTLTLDILPLQKSREECMEMYDEFWNLLQKSILCENKSFDEVTSDLSFIDGISGYPFFAEYEAIPRDYIQRDGKLVSKQNDNIPFEIKVQISCDYFDREEILSGTLVNFETDEDKFEREVSDYLNALNEENRTQKTINLDGEIAGQNVTWKVKKKSKLPKIAALCVLAEVAFFVKEKSDKREKIKKRKEKLREEYPEFAMKYALLFNAGLPHAKVIERIVSDKNKTDGDNPLYEELNRVISGVKSGVSLREALAKMSESCDMDEIRYFNGLISRNIQKGGGEMANEIKKAAKDSINMKRDEFKRKSETAGTKLTIPMVILLGIVFVFIMYPAFSQFSF